MSIWHDDDHPHDECGVFGVVAPGRDVSRLTFFGLHALQHRGQESAGIAVSDGRHILVQRELGLVGQVFDEPALRSLTGHAAIGHVRYSTTGANKWDNAQPVARGFGTGLVALGHNGNLTNTDRLRRMLEERGEVLDATTDSELVAALLAQDASGSLLDAVCRVMPELQGAFSVVCMTEGELVAFRDRHGVRPLCIGWLEGGWCVASETCALDQIGAEFLREVRPGEAVRVSAEGVESRQALEPARRALCVFETIYFARPDSRIDGMNIWEARHAMGRVLAEEGPAQADLVVGLPDSGTPAAIGYAQASGIPYAEAVVRNRYVGRSFIQPDQGLRQHGVRLKFNPLPAVIAGKRLVVVDDSIVRGTTTHKTVAMLFEAGAREVHLRISSPPVAWPCFYGIDMPSRDELVAARSADVEDVRRVVGATSLGYLSPDGLQRALGRPADRFCRACFTGEYPIPIPDSTTKLRFEDREAAGRVSAPA